MRNALTVAGREIQSSFVTPLAYVMFAGFAILSGFFFFSLLQTYNGLLAQAAFMPEGSANANLNEYVVTPFYRTLEVVLVFLLPVLTMRSIAEERRSGTFELLATSPLKVNELVLGKFLGTGFVVFVMLCFALIFPLFLILFADPERASIFVGFSGLVLFSLSFIALGVALSSFTKSQAVAGVLTLIVFLLLYVIDAPASGLGDKGAAILNYISPVNHTEPLLKGVVDGGDLVYFLTVMILGFFLANQVLSAERWRQ